jgi:hypothetical protein
MITVSPGRSAENEPQAQRFSTPDIPALIENVFTKLIALSRKAAERIVAGQRTALDISPVRIVA